MEYLFSSSSVFAEHYCQPLMLLLTPCPNAEQSLVPKAVERFNERTPIHQCSNFSISLHEENHH